MNESADGGWMDGWERIVSFSPRSKAHLMCGERFPPSGACWWSCAASERTHWLRGLWDNRWAAS